MRVRIESETLSEDYRVMLERWARWTVHLTHDIYLEAPPDYAHDMLDSVSDLVIQGGPLTQCFSMGSIISLIIGEEGMETWTKALAVSAAFVFARPTIEQRIEWVEKEARLESESWPSSHYALQVGDKVHSLMYGSNSYLQRFINNSAGDTEMDDEEPDLGAFTDYISGLEW